jgi:hypothetical protein
VHGLDAKYAGEIEFVYLDIDDPNTTVFKQQLGFIYQPHLLLLDGDGNVLSQWIGIASESDLNAALMAASG